MSNVTRLLNGELDQEPSSDESAYLLFAASRSGLPGRIPTPLFTPAPSVPRWRG